MNAEAHGPDLSYPPEWEIWPLPQNCEGRLLLEKVLLDNICSKWAILAVITLSRDPARFNQLRRALRGVTQKVLTQALRRLERSGMISRTVLETSPVSVEYAITPLGRTLAGPYSAVYRWIRAHRSEVETAQRRFDARRQQIQAVSAAEARDRSAGVPPKQDHGDAGPLVRAIAVLERRHAPAANTIIGRVNTK